LPLVWAWVVTPAGQQFTGLLFNANDGNTYLAKMEEGRQGAWVFHLAHTSEQGGNGAVIFVFYLLLGKIAGLLHLPNILIFHFARVLAGWLLLEVSYRFITLLFTDIVRQKLAFRLVCVASGFGWLLVAFGVNAPDFWVAEGYTFLSIFANPHFPLATALLILALTETLLGLEQQQWLHYLKAAIATLVLGFVHPFLLITLAGILAVYWLWLSIANRRPDWWGMLGLIMVGLTGTPGPFLTWWGTENDPLLKAWMSQNQTITLDPLTSLSGYGLLVPLSIIEIWWIARRLPALAGKNSLLNRRWQLVVIWLLVTVGLLALPLNFSRRFLEGIHLPLCCLAAAGYYFLVIERFRFDFKGRLLVGISALSSVVMVVISIALVYLPQDNLNDPVRVPYLSAGEIGAIEWLQQHSKPEEVVLTGPLLGNVLPGRLLIHVFYGHSMETINSEQKLAIMQQFFALETPDATRQQIIQTWQLNYLLYTWREQNLGKLKPATKGWQLVYSAEGVQLYRF